MSDEIGNDLAHWREGERDRLVQLFGDRPVWGVVSTFAADSFSAGMTHAEALDLATSEAGREPGRDATIVIAIDRLIGRPL